MPDVNLSAPEFSPENENPQRRSIRATRVDPNARSEKPVKVCIITEARPFLIIREENKPERLEPQAHGAVVETPEWLADFLVANKHAVRV